MEPLPKVVVSLEPIYKDDEGNPIPKLQQIIDDQELTHVYEPPYDPAAELRKNHALAHAKHDGIRNITIQGLLDNPTAPDDPAAAPSESSTLADDPTQEKEWSFTTDDLAAMREKMLGMIDLAKRTAGNTIFLLDALTKAPEPGWVPVPDQLAPGTLAISKIADKSTAVPVALPSVRAFNAQLVVGTKDKMYRQASDIFQNAANRMDSTLEKNDRYWESAIRLRRSNWSLVPAPLHEPGHARDFRIAYGLEHSPPGIRQSATAMIKDKVDPTEKSLLRVIGPTRRLRIGLSTSLPDGTTETGFMAIPPRVLQEGAMSSSEAASMDRELAWAQAASMESELYEEVKREALSLPSASARITEGKISIDAAVDSILIFEQVDVDKTSDSPSNSSSETRNSIAAALVYNLLVILLVRAHRATVRARSQFSNALTSAQGMQHTAFSIPLKPPPILGPVIALLQYDSFVQRMKRIFHELSSGLGEAGIACEADMTAVGDDITQVLVKSALLAGRTDDAKSSGSHPVPAKTDEIKPTLEHSMNMLMTERDELLRLNGEASLRVGGRHPVRFTFTTPAVLTLHLPQASIDIYDEAQLDRFMVAEVGRCVLERLREVGTRAEAQRSGNSDSAPTQWLVDGLEGTLIADKADSRIQMRITFDKTFKLSAVAIKTTTSGTVADSHVLRYPNPTSPGTTIEEWLERML